MTLLHIYGCPADSSALDRPVTECDECKQPLAKIDNGGQILAGCITCNLWRDQDGNVVRLSVEDLSAPACISQGIRRG